MSPRSSARKKLVTKFRTSSSLIPLAIGGGGGVVRVGNGVDGGGDCGVRVGTGVGTFFFKAEDGIRVRTVTGVQTCALPIWLATSTVRNTSVPGGLAQHVGGGEL